MVRATVRAAGAGNAQISRASKIAGRQFLAFPCARRRARAVSALLWGMANAQVELNHQEYLRADRLALRRSNSHSPPPRRTPSPPPPHAVAAHQEAMTGSRRWEERQPRGTTLPLNEEVFPQHRGCEQVGSERRRWQRGRAGQKVRALACNRRGGASTRRGGACLVRTLRS